MRKILCFFGFHKYRNEPRYELVPAERLDMLTRYEKRLIGTAVVCKYCRKELMRW